MPHQLSRIIILLGALLLAGCQSFHPEDMDYDVAPGIGPEKPMEYGVYTPPDWQPGERLPMILFLHGGGDNHAAFERYGAHRYFDEQINSGNMPRVILVTPDGGLSFWEDWADGSRLVRSTVLDSVIPSVQAEYGTLPCPEHCHLLGMSMGGQGVLRMAHLHNDRFSSVSALSTPLIIREGDEKPPLPWFIKAFVPIDRIFGDAFRDSFDEQDPFNAWINDPDTQQVRLQLLWGSDEGDRILLTNRKLHQHLKENGVDHDAYEYAGGHKWIYWIPNFGRAVNFLLAEPETESG